MEKKMKKLLILLLFIPLYNFSQILNIEHKRIDNDTTKCTGVSTLSLQHTNIGTKMTDIKLRSTLQRNFKNKDVLLLTGKYWYTIYDSIKVSNAAYIHLRYTKKLNKTIKWETFTQAQKNAQMMIKSRYLAGTGLRFKLIDKKILLMNFGNAYMYEYERYTNKDPISRKIRMSSYLTTTYNKTDKLMFYHTIYYQPQIDNFNNYRVLNQMGMEFDITKRFKFAISYDINYMSVPPTGVKKWGESLSNDISFSF